MEAVAASLFYILDTKRNQAEKPAWFYAILPAAMLIFVDVLNKKQYNISK